MQGRLSMEGQTSSLKGSLNPQYYCALIATVLNTAENATVLAIKSIMFENPEISERHKVALERGLMSHRSTVDQILVSDLYCAAKAVTFGNKASVNANFNVNIVKSKEAVVGTATDSQTGLYVQLAMIDDSKNLLLTFGQKWAAEGKAGVGQSGLTLW